MATIDIRATVTCSLGPLISGSISDDYLQNSGLVMTRGSCEITGIHTPAVGTGVTFSYTGPAGNQTVPRELLVLSSFADPFRNTTTVELGCRLTYLKDTSPAPSVDGVSSLMTGRRQQCLNGYVDYPANSKVGFPISAAALMDTCLGALGITASRNPLTNMFNRDSVDLSAGYVPVLGDLLLSEGYAGYMDAAGTLQILDLSTEGGSGPQVTSDHIVDLGAIGVGDLPGEAVIVRYNSTKLKGALDTTDSAELKLKNWEEEEVEGDPQTFEVRYTSGTGTQTQTATYIPYSKTITKYGKDGSFDETACVISGREGADLSNSVLSRETKERSVIGVDANNYCTELLSAGLTVDISFQGTSRKVETYEYDDKGKLVKQTSEVYEPYFKWLGGIDVDYVYYDSNGAAEAVAALSSEVLVERTIVEYDWIYGRSVTYLKAGETYDPPVLAEKVTTTVFQNWTLTQQGQQGAAQIKESAPFANRQEAEDWLARTAKRLVLADTQVRTNRPREIGGQVRAAAENLLSKADNTSTETTASIAYAMGSAQADRYKSFSMPYQSDDIYLSSGAVRRGDAASKALRFGRIQNRLLMGNRNGVNLQLHPSKMPANPFDPLYLTQGGLTVQYRANGIAWAFDNNGIVASVDALYWGVAGGTGTAWVPVAPGVTTFPPAPPVVGGVIDVPSVVPPWDELVPLEGVTRTVAEVKDYAYVIGSLGTTDIGYAVTHTEMQYTIRLGADSRVFNVAGQDSGLKYTRGVAANVGTFNLTGMDAGSVGFYVLHAENPSYDISGKAALFRYQRNPMPADAGTFNLTGMNAGSFIGKGLELEGATFTTTGEGVNMLRTYVISAAVGGLVTTGQDAGYSNAFPLAAAALSYTGNGTAKGVTGAGFKPGFMLHHVHNGSSSMHVFDYQRGPNTYFAWNDSNVEATSTTALTSFDSDGFSVGSNTLFNQNGAAYVALLLKEGLPEALNTSGTIDTRVSANDVVGYSAFHYVGDGTSGATVAHGLSATPELVIVRNTQTTGSALVVGSPLIGTGLYLNGTVTLGALASAESFQAFDSATLTLGNLVNLNALGRGYMAYAFRSTNNVKVGTLAGAGSSKLIVNLGFRPAFVYLKSFSGNASNHVWYYRLAAGDGNANYIFSDTTSAGTSGTVAITSTGFEIGTAGIGNGGAGNPAIYLAVR